VVVKKNEHETLSYRCDECDGNGYCTKGAARYDLWLKRVTAAPVPASEPKAAEPKPAPAAEPAAKLKRIVTLLG